MGKQSRSQFIFHLIIFSLSLLLHIIVITLFFFIKPSPQTSNKVKLINLISMQQGNDTPVEIAKQQISQPKQTKVRNNQPPVKQVSEIPSVPQEVVTENTLPVDTTPISVSPVASTITSAETTSTPVEKKSSSMNSRSANKNGSALGIVDAGAVGIKPAKISGQDPPYPEIAQDMGIEGKVSATLTIDTTGKVVEVQIISAPHKSMSESVTSTVKRWKFKPVMYKGSLVSVKVKQEIEFTLD